MNVKKNGKSHISVNEYFSQQIALSGKKLREISSEVGYKGTNIISMMKMGRTKIPLNKIVQLAKAIGVDPVHFMRVVMNEYNPQTWEVIESVIGGYLVSENEIEILNIIRETAQGIDVSPENDEERLELMTLIAKWRDKRLSLADAAMKNQ